MDCVKEKNVVKNEERNFSKPSIAKRCKTEAGKRPNRGWTRRKMGHHKIFRWDDRTLPHACSASNTQSLLRFFFQRSLSLPWFMCFTHISLPHCFPIFFFFATSRSLNSLSRLLYLRLKKMCAHASVPWVIGLPHRTAVFLNLSFSFSLCSFYCDDCGDRCYLAHLPLWYCNPHTPTARTRTSSRVSFTNLCTTTRTYTDTQQQHTHTRKRGRAYSVDLVIFTCLWFAISMLLSIIFKGQKQTGI